MYKNVSLVVKDKEWVTSQVAVVLWFQEQLQDSGAQMPKYQTSSSKGKAKKVPYNKVKKGKRK